MIIREVLGLRTASRLSSIAFAGEDVFNGEGERVLGFDGDREGLVWGYEERIPLAILSSL